MKNALLLSIFMSLSLLLSAQPENYATGVDQFQADYNAEQYAAIFERFSPEMQTALPLETTKQFLAGLKAQVGNIQEKDFIKHDEATGAVYRAQFERAILGIYITVNDQDQIAGLLIKPYEEPANVEVANVKALEGFPNELAELIFEKTKQLPNKAQLSIAIIDKGEVNYYGIIREGEAIKAHQNQSQIFEIGSISKVFTSTVLASLVGEQQINLTDPINPLYPFDFKGSTPIIFEQLANHTSGLARLPQNLDLSNTSNPYKAYGKAEMEKYLQDLLSLDSEPGTQYAYSNLGAGLLGYTLGVSQNTSFQALLQKRVFEKYGMQQSYTSNANLGDVLVKGLDKEGNAVSNWDFDALFAAGGVLSCTEDLAKFAQAQFNPADKALALTQEPTFKVKDDLKIGLGWHIITSKSGRDLHWHNGSTGGYSSSMTLDVTNKRAVIILSNMANSNDVVDPLGFELMKQIAK